MRTPEDNGVNERFNRTVKEGFIQLGNFDPDPEIFNSALTEWLVEYNFNCPHPCPLRPVRQDLTGGRDVRRQAGLPTCVSRRESLGYLTPMELLNEYQKVLPMYPSSTLY